MAEYKSIILRYSEDRFKKLQDMKSGDTWETFFLKLTGIDVNE